MNSEELAAVSGDANAAVLSERMRVTAIIESPEGKRNPAMANKLALYSSLDADTARSILAEAPAANPYLAAMDKEGPIGITAAAADLTSDAKTARMEEIKVNVAAHNAVKGYRKA